MISSKSLKVLLDSYLGRSVYSVDAVAFEKAILPLEGGWKSDSKLSFSVLFCIIYMLGFLKLTRFWPAVD